MSETVETVRVMLLGGPADGWGPFGWDNPIPTTVTVVQEGRADSWTVLFPGQQLGRAATRGPSRRYVLDQAAHTADPWTAVYRYAGADAP